MDARILNDNTIKRKAQMPNLEELLGQVCLSITKDENMPLYISTIDLEYAFGQISLHPETRKHCNIAIIGGGGATGYYQFKKGFYGLSDMPTIFQEKIDKTLEHKTPAWQDDIIIVTRSTPQEHIAEVREVLTKLENAGYKASKEKSKFLKPDAEWLGYKITKEGIKPLRDKTEAIRNLKSPKNVKDVRSFLGSVQYLAKHIPSLSEKTAPIRELLKKDSIWNWSEQQKKLSTK